MNTLHELERSSGVDIASDDYWAQARLGILRRWIDQRHPDVVLDIGCGSGYLAAAITAPGRTVHGIDIDADLISLAEARDTQAEFSVGDAREIDFPDNAADIVVLADLIEHFEDPGPVLNEAGRVCRPDGSVIVSVPANGWLYGPHDADQGHARRYDPAILDSQADAAGLTVTQSRYTNFMPLAPYALYQRVLKRDVPSSVRGGHSSSLLQGIKRALLRLEHRIDWPTGVTLLAELAPHSDPDDESVLLTNYEYPPGCGGGGVFTHDLCRELRDRGAAVHLVAGMNRSALIPNGMLDIAAYPFRSFRSLDRTLRHRDCEVIHSHFSLPTSTLLPVLKHRHGTPYVVSVMGADVHDPTRYRRLRPALDALNNHWVFRYADAITVASSGMYDRIPERHQEKTHIIPYFVDTERYTPRSAHHEPREPLRLLTVARLVPRKNISAALKTVRRLRHAGELVKYTIVGSGSGLERLQHITDELGIKDAVTFTGYVSENELVGIYRDHDVFILPSVHEGFGIVLIEAMACGLPVIATANGGPVDIVTQETGVLISDRVEETLPKAIDEVRTNYAQLAHSARQRATQHYSIPTVIEQYQKLYADVVNGGVQNA